MSPISTTKTRTDFRRKKAQQQTLRCRCWTKTFGTRYRQQGKNGRRGLRWQALVEGPGSSNNFTIVWLDFYFCGTSICIRKGKTSTSGLCKFVLPPCVPRFLCDISMFLKRYLPSLYVCLWVGTGFESQRYFFQATKPIGSFQDWYI